MTQAAITIRDLSISYDGHRVLDGISTQIPAGRFTAILGANGCGKSSLLRSMANLLRPTGGQLWLGTQGIAALRPRRLARELAMLPQSPLAPEGISVIDLVRRGRFAHQGFFPSRSQEDERIVAKSLSETGLAELADHPVARLSGGQRQRVWIAMVLAQNTPILLLDEPTSFLDLAHQIELMQLLVRLKDEGRTVIAVLHDINQAARYSDHLITLANGTIAASGAPMDIVTPALIRQVYGLEAMVAPDPVAGTPMAIAL